MNDTGVVDTFLNTFTTYIDSGFGLLGGEVHFLSATLVVIDVTLAALFWAWAPGEDILARLIKKTLYVGFFAFLIGNFNQLAKIVFESFSGLGLKAAGGGMSAADFLHPGKIAQQGITAGMPILQAISQMSGFPGIFENFVQIAVMLISFLIVLIAFFILAIQLFITLIEFKLTTLAGFVLVPFGLFGKTAFLAEKVLGNVIASGVKVLVLAVIVGIGSTLFGQFTQSVGGGQPTLEQVLALALAALSLLGLGIFARGSPAAWSPARLSLARARRSARASRSAAWRSPELAPSARPPAVLPACAARRRLGRLHGQVPPVPATVATARRAGPRAAARRAAALAAQRPVKARRPRPRVVPSGGSGPTGASESASEPPAWAQRAQHAQALSHGLATAAHAVKSGDAGGAGAHVSLSEDA